MTFLLNQSVGPPEGGGGYGVGGVGAGRMGALAQFLYAGVPTVPFLLRFYEKQTLSIAFLVKKVPGGGAPSQTRSK